MTKQKYWIAFVIVTTGVVALSCIWSVLYSIKQLTGFSEMVSYIISAVPFSFCMAGYVVIAEGIRGNRAKTWPRLNLFVGYVSFILCGLTLCLPAIVFWLHHNFYDVDSNAFKFWSNAIVDVSTLSPRLTIEGVLIFAGTCMGIHLICKYFHIQA